MINISKLNNLDCMINYFIGAKPSSISILLDDYFDEEQYVNDEKLEQQYNMALKDEALLWHNNIPLPY